MIDYFDAVLVVDAALVAQAIKRCFSLALEILANLDQRGRVHHHPRVRLLVNDFEDSIAELCFGPVVYLERLHAQARKVGGGTAPLLGALVSHRSVIILSCSLSRPSVSA